MDFAGFQDILYHLDLLWDQVNYQKVGEELFLLSFSKADHLDSKFYKSCDSLGPCLFSCSSSVLVHVLTSRLLEKKESKWLILVCSL